MKCEVIEVFRVNSSKGEIELQPGQILILQKEKALKLLSELKIVPAENGAHRVYSDFFQNHIWIVMDKAELEALREYQDTSEPIYTADDELKMLKGMDQDVSESIKNAKVVFELAIVKEFLTEVSEE